MDVVVWKLGLGGRFTPVGSVLVHMIHAGLEGRVRAMGTGYRRNREPKCECHRECGDHTSNPVQTIGHALNR